MQISIGDFIEVSTAGCHHNGVSGIVESIDGTTATVQPVNTNDDWLTPKGDCFEIHVAELTKVPTPTELRRAKRHLREKHLAGLQPPHEVPTGMVREFSALLFFDHRGADW